MNVLFLTETWFLMVMALTPQFYGVFPSIICHLENLFDLLTYIDRWFEIVTLAKNVVVYQEIAVILEVHRCASTGDYPFL